MAALLGLAWLCFASSATMGNDNNSLGKRLTKGYEATGRMRHGRQAMIGRQKRQVKVRNGLK